MKAATRRRYLADPEGWESKSRAWKRAHPELVKGRGKRWQAENPEKLALYGWRKNIKKLYGLTQVKFETQLAFQKGVCAICGKKNKNGRRLSVDHSHNTGDLRGLLCFGCNNVLGHGFDSVEILQAAIAYLLAGGVWQTKK